MRQKYIICRDNEKNSLSVTEYAILEKIPKNQESPMIGGDPFSKLYEETYDSSIIMASIGKGLDALVSVLRTRNMFPVRSNAIKIAESIMDLYDLDGGGSVDLFFDDIEQLDREAMMAT